MKRHAGTARTLTYTPDNPTRRAQGDKGVPETVTLYRVTPRNVTDLRNKNTGSAAGDLTFRYSAMLGGAGAFLAGDNIVGRFPVSVSVLLF